MEKHRYYIKSRLRTARKRLGLWLWKKYFESDNRFVEYVYRKIACVVSRPWDEGYKGRKQ